MKTKTKIKMKKVFLLGIIVISLIAIIYAKNKIVTDYQIISEKYTDRGVTITYPQIDNLGDETLEKNINLLIKEAAITPYVETLDGLEPSSSYEVEQSYEIKLKSKKYLSVAFSSYNDIIPSVHPYILFHTVNIDMTNGSIITLKDVVPDIDESFIKSIKSGKYVGAYADAPEDAKIIKEAVFDEFNDEMLLDIIKGKEPYREVYFYLTQDSIGISLPVSHVLGDHAEFEVSNRELGI